MFATTKAARLIYTSNSTVAKAMKGLVGSLSVSDDHHATFKVGDTRMLNTSVVRRASAHGRWLSIQTDHSVYCFEAI